MIVSQDVEPDVRQDWQTPDELWQGLNAEFQFDLDVAANADNAKVLRFISKTMDGLTTPWDGQRIWCNPPYKQIRPWVDKAVELAQSVGKCSVLLLPARVEQKWFRTVLCHSIELAFFNRRIQFTPPRGVSASSNREGSILAVFGGTKFGRRETIRDAKTGAVLHEWGRK